MSNSFVFSRPTDVVQGMKSKIYRNSPETSESVLSVTQFEAAMAFSTKQLRCTSIDTGERLLAQESQSFGSVVSALCNMALWLSKMRSPIFKLTKASPHTQITK